MSFANTCGFEIHLQHCTPGSSDCDMIECEYYVAWSPVVNDDHSRNTSGHMVAGSGLHL